MLLKLTRILKFITGGNCDVHGIFSLFFFFFLFHDTSLLGRLLVIPINVHYSRPDGIQKIHFHFKIGRNPNKPYFGML